ncbi:MAG: alkaline phosphatase family protein, partial [Actinomycetota bacterium]
VYRRADLPLRFRLEGSPRVPPIVALADEGWTIEWRAAAAETRAWNSFGDHGYDDSLPVMRAIFIAHGPAFRRGLVVPPFRNIHIYPLLAEVLGLRPAPTDGTVDSMRVMLSSPLPARASRLPLRPPPRSRP